MVYNWYKNDNKLPEAGQQDITFSSLKFSDAAEYTCNATNYKDNVIYDTSDEAYTIMVQSEFLQ